MLVSINDVSKSFGDKTILDGVNFTIEDTDRIGLIGINGAGKSTLLNIICDKLHYEQGEVHRKSDLKIGFLEQNSGLDKANTIFTEMLSVYDEVLALETKMRALEKQMAAHQNHDNEDYSSIAKEYSALQEHFDKSDGYKVEVNIKIILNGMGFGDKDYDMNIASLSGGEKTRLALAKLLLEQPELLILDEPTNHLDFSTLLWLEGYLQSYKGAILVVSHDRYFLDKIVKKIWELERTKAFTYRGNYSKYKILREERIQNQLKQYEQQQLQIASMQEYVEKNIARASTSNSAKSRVHALERMERIEKPIEYTKTAKLIFDYDTPPVKDVLTIADLSLVVGSGDAKVTLAKDIDLEIKRGERVALIGANGIGKSTMLKAILGLNPQKGSIAWGKHVTTSYYEQENLNLNSNNTALEELWHRFPREIESKIRSNLGRVLLTGDSVFKKVSVLSGGERAKLALAVMLMQRSNTLILDEPTNHLDLVSKEVLEGALSGFDGTMLFVSHDRYFLNEIPTKIVELTKDGIITYNGNFDYYLEKSKLLQEQLNTIQEKVEKKPKEESNAQKTNYRSKQQRSEDVKRRTRINALEKLIMEHEELIEMLHDEIASPEVSSDYQLVAQKCDDLEQAKQLLEQYMDEWLDLTDE